MNPDPLSLNRLHDVIAPPPLPWWPPAPGWLWLGGAMLLMLLGVLTKAFLVWQHDHYRREALAEMRRQEALLEDPARRAAVMSSVATVLKRAALTAWPRDQVASLTGPAWFAFLDQSGGMNAFARGTGEVLDLAVSDPAVIGIMDVDRLREVTGHARQWIRDHRRAAAPGRP